MQAGVDKVVSRSQTVILSIQNQREILKVVITISINGIENHKVKESLHVNHPCSDIRPDSFGDILIAAVVFELESGCLFVLAYYRGKLP